MTLTAEEARKIWRYDPETGDLFWLISPRSNRIEIGERAGWNDAKRYWRVNYGGKCYHVAHIAWLIMNGYLPTAQIDHINRISSDNRWSNLREASVAENCYNRKRKKPNKLGVKGVHIDKGSITAVIGVNGKRIRLGSFKTIEAAKAAYDAAVKKYHGEFAVSKGEVDVRPSL